jgi:hypothetical protein
LVSKKQKKKKKTVSKVIFLLQNHSTYINTKYTNKNKNKKQSIPNPNLPPWPAFPQRMPQHTQTPGPPQRRPRQALRRGRGTPAERHRASPAGLPAGSVRQTFPLVMPRGPGSRCHYHCRCLAAAAEVKSDRTFFFFLRKKQKKNGHKMEGGSSLPK